MRNIVNNEVFKSRNIGHCKFRRVLWLTSVDVQADSRKLLRFGILLWFTGVNLVCLMVDAVWAANPELLHYKYDSVSKIASFKVKSITLKQCQTPVQAASNLRVSKLHMIQMAELPSTSAPSINLEEPPPPANQQQAPPPPANQQQAPPPPTSKESPNNPPPLEGQPNNFPAPSPGEVEQRLPAPEIDYEQRLKKLLQLLQEKQQVIQQDNYGELGNLVVEEKPLEQLPPPPVPAPRFKPIGYLQANIGYFQTSNVFSSAINPKVDGLVYSGLTLTSAPLPLTSKTFLTGSINGSLIRYLNQGRFNYNQLIFNVNVYQQLTSKMYGQIGWNNQQLFYSRNSKIYRFASGDRFDNENSVYLSLGRRDLLTPKLMIDSYYQLSFALTNPPRDRNRIVNNVWVSLNYYWQKSLQVGIDYQFNSSNFTQRDRFDQYNRIYSHLNYGISPLSNIGLQAGVTLGSSTDRSINFNGWFFSVNYNWDIGQF